MKNSKEVMVTGAAGFVGSHLIDSLLANNFIVYALDQYPIDQCANLSHLANSKNFHYTCADIRDEEQVNSFFRKESSMLYHLASVVGVNRYMEDPFLLIDITILGTKNLLKCCLENKTRILFSSTSEVYGKNPVLPWKEEDDRVLGNTSIDRWSYSSSKAVVEHMLFGLYRSKKLNFSIVRFFNVYGPRQNPIFVISQSIYKILKGESPDLYDGGKQTRCFTYIGDIVKGIISAGTNLKAVGQIFNLGSKEEISMQEAISTCIKFSNKKVKVNPIDTTKKYGKIYEDIPRRIPDVSKAEKLLGWKADTSFETGIQETIKWSQANEWYLK